MAKNNKIMLLFVCLLNSSIRAQPVTVNEKNINEYMKPEQVLTYKTKADNIAFSFSNNNLSMGEINLSSEELENIRDSYQELQNNKKQLASMVAGKKLIVEAGVSNTHNNAFLGGGESIYLEAGDITKINNAILQSRIIVINSKKLELSSCYIVAPEILQLQANVPEDNIFKAIRFYAKKNAPFMFVQGNIDFEVTKMNEAFIIFGANKMEIKFGPKAFE